MDSEAVKSKAIILVDKPTITTPSVGQLPIEGTEINLEVSLEEDATELYVQSKHFKLPSKQLCTRNSGSEYTYTCPIPEVNKYWKYNYAESNRAELAFSINGVQFDPLNGSFIFSQPDLCNVVYENFDDMYEVE